MGFVRAGLSTIPVFVGYFTVAAAILYLSSTDFIRFPSCESGEVGVLVDGIKASSLVLGEGTFLNDERTVGMSDADLNIGNFFAGGIMVGEVIAFAQDVPPFVRERISWSLLEDRVSVSLSAPLTIDVSVWIVTGGAESLLSDPDFQDFCEIANQIWSNETNTLITRKNGLVIRCLPPQVLVGKDIVVKDDLDNIYSVEDYYRDHPFECGAEGVRIKRVVPKSNRLKIFFVDRVDIGNGLGLTDYGVWCGDNPDVIAMGKFTDVTVLAHEITHALTSDSGHIDGLSTNDFGCPIAECLFDEMNVMHGASSVRATVTEGQVFRAFYNQGGALNKLYAIGPGVNLTPPRYCGTTTDIYDRACPSVQTRLWPDGKVNGGEWPPN